VVQPLHEKAEDGRVPIAVDLRAAPRHSFAAGIGYSTDTEERLSLTWRTPRINRYGHSQETRLEFSRVNPSGRFTYQIPLSHPFNDVMQFWARIEDNEFGDLDSEQEELGVSREIRRGKWIYGYSLRGLDESWDRWMKISGKTICCWGLLCLAAHIVAHRSTRRVALINCIHWRWATGSWDLI
jgi:translocation and assembly module TamA